MQHRNFAGKRVHLSIFMQPLNYPELVCDLFDIIIEIRIFFCQMQISSQPDSVYRLPQKRSADPVPVYFGICSRIAPRCKSRCSTQSNRKQIGMQAQLMYRSLCAGAQSGFVSGKNTLDQTIKAKLLKTLRIRLYTNPAVIIENIRFLSVAVNNID